jgi:glycosyltransferase involved in cell wall biosynthesis
MVSEDVPHPSMGGLARHALTLAGALVDAGHSVDFLGSDQFPPIVAGRDLYFGGRFFGELNGHRVGWWESRIGMFLPPRRPWLARRFARIIMRRAGDYDVVHYHGHVPEVALYIPPEVNFIQTRHDQGSDCLMHTRFRNGEVCAETAPEACASCMTRAPSGLQRAVSALAVRRFRDAVTAGYRRHKTIFVSDLLHRNLCRTAGPGPWGRVVHNFVDADRLRQAVALAERPPGIPAEAFTVMIAGKLWPPKGVAPLLQGLVPGMEADMHLIVAGDGPEEAGLRSRYASAQVHFLGWCDSVRTLRLTAAADIAVIPSICEESCATTVLEGLFLGKPTLALHRGGTPELGTYQRYPGQLQLYPDMTALVAGVLQRPRAATCLREQEQCDVAAAAAALLVAYAEPRDTWPAGSGAPSGGGVTT